MIIFECVCSSFVFILCLFLLAFVWIFFNLLCELLLFCVLCWEQPACLYFEMACSLHAFTFLHVLHLQRSIHHMWYMFWGGSGGVVIIVKRSQVGSIILCVELACSPCVCVALWLRPTVHKRACKVNWKHEFGIKSHCKCKWMLVCLCPPAINWWLFVGVTLQWPS